MGHASPQDPEGWRGTTLHVGDYVEFACSDTSHCRQGAVLARLGRLNEKTRDGKWAEVSFIAASDEHLRWWLNTRDGAEDAWQFEVHFCPGPQRSCRRTRRGRARA